MISLLLAAFAAPQAPQTSTIQLADDVVVTGHLFTDVDGDGKQDLVLATRDESSARMRRLQVHVRRDRAPVFGSQPTQQFEIDRDVVAFAFCDCRKTPGRELVLLTPELVVVATRSTDGQLAYEELFAHRLVWPAADDDRVVPLQDSVVDYDGDGVSDLVLPQPDAWSIWRQTDQAFTLVHELTLPTWRSPILDAARGGALRSNGGSVELSFGGRSNDSSRGALARASTRTPQCEIVDLDGDQRLDLVTWRNLTMFTALQTEPRALTPHEQKLPVPEGRLKVLDPAFDVQFHDLNGDGMLDLLLVTTARRDDDVEARVEWFFTRKDGNWPDKSDGRLRLQALGAPVTLIDVDGDGKRDLVCVSVRTSAMKRLTADKTTALDAQLTVFPGSDAGFARPALLNRAVPLAAGKSELSALFAHVRNGSALLRVNGAIERRPLTGSGKRLRMRAADARVAVDDDARVVALRDDASELLIVTDHEVRHVEVR